MRAGDFCCDFRDGNIANCTTVFEMLAISFSEGQNGPVEKQRSPELKWFLGTEIAGIRLDSMWLERAVGGSFVRLQRFEKLHC
jgi:hypothetical protein